MLGLSAPNSKPAAIEEAQLVQYGKIGSGGWRRRDGQDPGRVTQRLLESSSSAGRGLFAS